MTKKTDNTNELDKKLEKAQQTNNKKNEKKQEENTANTIESLEKNITDLEKQLAEKDEIAKKAQFDYINLKMDFDGYQRRTESAQKDNEFDSLFKVVKKFLPFVESLRKSIETIPEDMQEDNLAKWVTLTYKNFLQTLEQMHITPIESVGLEPDMTMHEPVGMQPAPSEELKGKIIQEFERWFVYKKGDTEKVVSTSKVVVWQ